MVTNIYTSLSPLAGDIKGNAVFACLGEYWTYSDPLVYEPSAFG